MSKILKPFISTVLILFLVFILLPKKVEAQTITPTIGDLNIGESKEVIVSGLEAGKKYYWKESKVTSVIPTKGYAAVFTDCHNANSSSEVRRNIGPFSTPGLYLLAISRTSTAGGKCEPSGIPLVSQEFSVGGPTTPPKSCCNPPGFPVYDSGKDVCKKDITPLTPEHPTECTKTSPPSFCEPESLQCFTTKTLTLAGKICKNPKDPDFDKSKHVICGSSGVTPCDTTDLKNPGFVTAIGCIHTSPVGFIKDFLKFILGIAGGLAFLMMLLGAFQMLSSVGNPETLQAGRERLTSAIIGLLFVIFAVLLLRIIGVDILGLGEQFGFK